MPEPPVAIHLERVSREYASGAAIVSALRDVSLSVAPGEVIAITGPSGSGKTTLLNVIAGLDRPTDGELVVLGYRLNGLRESELTAFRARAVGIVFQDPHLLPGLTALENVAIAKLPWRGRRDLEKEAGELLVAVGLGGRLDFPSARLSGGERQRVGIARALLGKPALLLADEPTGNLDAQTTEDLLTLLDQLHREFRFTLLVATHDPSVAAVASRILHLVDGRLGRGKSAAGQPGLEAHSLE
ncbi:MAG: ABC transporter ATP-binding protein [Actinomycetota bacterium]|nr:ABC transporter ATP-binding protein [Actinomycetota bacterium]